MKKEYTGTSVVVQQRTQLSAADIREQVNLISEVMQAVMKPDVHYGVVPGTKKPSLFKAGAEKLCATFRIAEEYQVEDLSNDDLIRYRVRCSGVHQTTGVVLGSGIGECSSDEEKYKWRAAVCPEEFEDTAPTRRRIKYSKWNNKVERKQQVRTDPADAANTVLKMAAKRAKIHMTLNVTAASDFFTQDVEDLPEHLRHAHDGETYQQNAVQTQRDSKPPYTSENFAKNFDAWRNLIESGKRTSEQIISMVSSRATLTAEQMHSLRSIGERPVAAENVRAQTEQWEPTPEEIAAIRQKEMDEMAGQA